MRDIKYSFDIVCTSIPITRISGNFYWVSLKLNENLINKLYG